MTPMEQYAQYNTSKILTASPAELILMLYDGAIKFCNIAVMAIEKEDGEKAHNYILKVERIIDELRLSLDTKYEISSEFDQIYAYLLQRLLEANIKKDPEILKEVTGHLRSVRDNWKKVMEANQPAKAKVPTAVNQ